jgi:hypothetical protein
MMIAGTETLQANKLCVQMLKNGETSEVLLREVVLVSMNDIEGQTAEVIVKEMTNAYESGVQKKYGSLYAQLLQHHGRKVCQFVATTFPALTNPTPTQLDPQRLLNTIVSVWDILLEAHVCAQDSTNVHSVLQWDDNTFNDHAVVLRPDFCQHWSEHVEKVMLRQTPSEVQKQPHIQLAIKTFCEQLRLLHHHVNELSRQRIQEETDETTVYRAMSAFFKRFGECMVGRLLKVLSLMNENASADVQKVANAFYVPLEQFGIGMVTVSQKSRTAYLRSLSNDKPDRTELAAAETETIFVEALKIKFWDLSKEERSHAMQAASEANMQMQLMDLAVNQAQEELKQFQQVFEKKFSTEAPCTFSAAPSMVNEAVVAGSSMMSGNVAEIDHKVQQGGATMLRLNMVAHFSTILESVDIVLKILQAAMKVLTQASKTDEVYLSAIHMRGTCQYVAPNTVDDEDLNALVNTMCRHLFATKPELLSPIVRLQYGNPEALVAAVDKFVQESAIGKVFGSATTGPYQFSEIKNLAAASELPSAIVDASSEGSDHDAAAQADARFNLRPGAKTASGKYQASHGRKPFDSPSDINVNSDIHLV